MYIICIHLMQTAHPLMQTTRFLMQTTRPLMQTTCGLLKPNLRVSNCQCQGHAECQVICSRLPKPAELVCIVKCRFC